MPVLALTELTLRTLKKPEQGFVIYTDKGLSGFGVRVTSTGHASYVVTYGRARKRETIGDVGIVKLGDARKKAKDILAEFQINGDKPPSPPWGEAKDLYIKLHAARHTRKSTHTETKRQLARFDRFSETKLSEIDPAAVMAIIDKMHATPASANHHLVAVKGFLNWCVRRRYIPYNPLQSARKPGKTVSRDRVLSDDEIKAVLATAPSQGAYGQIVLWCLHTLQRRGQIAQLDAGFIDKKQKTIRWPAECMKGNRPHEVPYCGLYSTVPKAGLLFPNGKGNPWNAWSKPHKAFLKASETTGWGLHDLRRTGATRLAEMGHAPHVIERILAHASGTLTPLALVYNRATYLEEMRAALKAWSDYLHKLKPA